MGQPVVFTCHMENEEYLKVRDCYHGVLFEIHAPSQTSMDENGQVVLSLLDAKNLAYTLNHIIEEKLNEKRK